MYTYNLFKMTYFPFKICDSIWEMIIFFCFFCYKQYFRIVLNVKTRISKVKIIHFQNKKQ